MAEINKQKKTKQMVASIAACVLVLGGSTVAYAADVGSIQRTLQLWMQGDQTQVVLEYNGDGSYEMDYTNSDGTTGHQGGGGVAFDSDGNERPLTEEEILDALDDPDVRYEDDGSVWVYYFDQKIDITDKFEDGVCYVRVSHGDETLYLTVKYENGFSSSPHKYMSPDSFN